MVCPLDCLFYNPPLHYPSCNSYALAKRLDLAGIQQRCQLADCSTAPTPWQRGPKTVLCLGLAQDTQNLVNSEGYESVFSGTLIGLMQDQLWLIQTVFCTNKPVPMETSGCVRLCGVSLELPPRRGWRLCHEKTFKQKMASQITLKQQNVQSMLDEKKNTDRQ